MKGVNVIALTLLCISVNAQNSFSDATSTLADAISRSGSPIGIADMNGDGLDDLVRLHLATTFQIDFQKINGGFTGYSFGNLAGTGREWGMCIADVDQNGYNDLLAGGSYNGLKRLLANSTGTAWSQGTLPNAPPNGIFLQSSNLVDIDNDGNIDYFACHDDGLSAPYRGSASGSFTWDTTLIAAYSTLPSDNSGNYGSVWTDYDWDGDVDLFITKCRGFVTEPLDGRRLNLLFENDGTNEFEDVAEEVGLRPLYQSWATDFGDLDNDGDMDAFTLHHMGVRPSLYYNDGTDHYVLMNDSAGIVADLQTLDQGIQVIFEDFDNDGLLDIFATNVIDGGHRLFWNLGNMEFDHVSNLFPSGMPYIHSASIGDLNHDGFIDIFAGHGTGYNNPSTQTLSTYDDDLLINQGNDNHFLSVRTIGDESNINGIGTRLILLSDLGAQRRDIRSGESYGIMTSLNAHFGMGEDENVDSLILYWPSGETDLFENLRADQFLTLHEGIGPCDCNEPGVQTVTALTGNGAGSLPYAINHACPCDTIRFAESLMNDTVVVAERLMIGKDLVIKGDGTGKTWISTTTSTAAIRIQPGVHCMLSQLTLDDDASIPPLYLIENLGSLTLENVTLDAPFGVPLRPVTGTWIIGSGTTEIR